MLRVSARTQAHPLVEPDTMDRAFCPSAPRHRTVPALGGFLLRAPRLASHSRPYTRHHKIAARALKIHRFHKEESLRQAAVSPVDAPFRKSSLPRSTSATAP